MMIKLVNGHTYVKLPEGWAIYYAEYLQAVYNINQGRLLVSERLSKAPYSLKLIKQYLGTTYHEEASQDALEGFILTNLDLTRGNHYEL
jgi:hypothetical protein